MLSLLKGWKVQVNFCGLISEEERKIIFVESIVKSSLNWK